MGNEDPLDQTKLKPNIPSQGWRQILAARKEMLDAYDIARDKAKSHKVQVYHGKVAEAACRKWLIDFLPKRFGVTSGFVVSSGLTSKDKVPHFDVIIYDQLESPVLWIEDSHDTSDQGRSRAIPVEHVRAVLEVKSSFSSRTVREAINHLRELSPVMGLDDHREHFRFYLPRAFHCGLLFFELRQESAYDEQALIDMIDGYKLRGFFGGLILRGEGETLPCAARIWLATADGPVESTIGRKREALLDGLVVSKSVETEDGQHLTSIVSCCESDFAMFAFDLVARLQGTHEVGRASSFYGLGSTAAEERQSEQPSASAKVRT